MDYPMCRMTSFQTSAQEETYVVESNDWVQKFDVPDYCPGCGGLRWYDYQTEPEVGIEYHYDENGYLDEAKCDECGHTYYPPDDDHV